MTGNQFRAYRRNKTAYLDAVKTVFPEGVQLRQPNGFVIRVVRGQATTLTAPIKPVGPQVRKMLCLLTTGEPVRQLEPHESALFERALANDPRKIGAVQLPDGKAYYVRDIVVAPTEEEEAEEEEEEQDDGIRSEAPQTQQLVQSRLDPQS